MSSSVRSPELLRVMGRRDLTAAVINSVIGAGIFALPSAVAAFAGRILKKDKDGDAKSAAIYSAAYGINPEFYAFYRSLEAYRATFRNRGDVMVLDPSSDFFRYFRQSGGRDGARAK